MAGQISFMPLKPAYAHTSQNGTSTEKKGRMRPTCAPSVNSEKPLTAARAMMGVPSAP